MTRIHSVYGRLNRYYTTQVLRTWVRRLDAEARHARRTPAFGPDNDPLLAGPASKLANSEGKSKLVLNHHLLPQAALRVLTELVTQYSVSRRIRIRSSACDSMLIVTRLRLCGLQVLRFTTGCALNSVAYQTPSTRNKGYIQCADGPGGSFVR